MHFSWLPHQAPVAAGSTRVDGASPPSCCHCAPNRLEYSSPGCPIRLLWQRVRRAWTARALLFIVAALQTTSSVSPMAEQVEHIQDDGHHANHDQRHTKVRRRCDAETHSRSKSDIRSQTRRTLGQEHKNQGRPGPLGKNQRPPHTRRRSGHSFRRLARRDCLIRNRFATGAHYLPSWSQHDAAELLICEDDCAATSWG